MILLVYSSATLHTPQEVVQSSLLENTAMSMHPQSIDPVPQDTARVARSAFPSGNLYMQMGEVLGTCHHSRLFHQLFLTSSVSIAVYRITRPRVQLSLPSYLSCPPLAGVVEAKCNRCRSDSQRDRRSSTECLSGSVFGPHGDVGVGALHHHGRLESVSGNRA